MIGQIFLNFRNGRFRARARAHFNEQELIALVFTLTTAHERTSTNRN